MLKYNLERQHQTNMRIICWVCNKESNQPSDFEKGWKATQCFQDGVPVWKSRCKECIKQWETELQEIRGNPSKQIQEYIRVKAKAAGVTQKEYRKNLRCEDCCSDDRVSVHHEYYGKMATVHHNALRPLCYSCHYYVHVLTGQNDYLPVVDTAEELHRYQMANSFIDIDLIEQELTLWRWHDDQEFDNRLPQIDGDSWVELDGQEIHLFSTKDIHATWYYHAGLLKLRPKVFKPVKPKNTSVIQWFNETSSDNGQATA